MSSDAREYIILYMEGRNGPEVASYRSFGGLKPGADAVEWLKTRVGDNPAYVLYLRVGKQDRDTTVDSTVKKREQEESGPESDPGVVQ